MNLNIMQLNLNNENSIKKSTQIDAKPEDLIISGSEPYFISFEREIPDIFSFHAAFQNKSALMNKILDEETSDDEGWDDGDEDLDDDDEDWDDDDEDWDDDDDEESGNGDEEDWDEDDDDEDEEIDDDIESRLFGITFFDQE